MVYRSALAVLLATNLVVGAAFVMSKRHANRDRQSAANLKVEQKDFSCAVPKPAVLKVGSSTIEVTFAPGDFDLPREQILAWVSRAAHAVATYYGRFPSQHVRLRIVPVEGESGVFKGTTWGWGGGFTRVPVGQHTRARELRQDWILTHEFVHLAFPDMPDAHHWIEEGIATYVEPIARVEARQLGSQQMWHDVVRDMPKGTPQAGDRGLDHTHTWGRTYWGGAMYCMLADVEIRRQTNNQKGLQDALRAILNAGGTLDKENWTLERALKIGDRATGTQVLERLYAQMKDQPYSPNLPELWASLGVHLEKGELVFDDGAQWAMTRASITSPGRVNTEAQIAESETSIDDSADAAEIDEEGQN